MSDAAARATAARSALDRLLETDAQTLRALLPDSFGDAIERYVALLLETNARLNLTRIVDPEPIAKLHLLDAISALPVLDRIGARRAIEIGSGGGVPGLVLAIARPEMSWTLVDSVRKKADALRSFAAALELSNVEVLGERAETMGRDPAHRERYDVVAARACASLPVLAEYALPLARVGGSLLAWKAELADDELRRGRTAAAELGGGGPEVLPAGIDLLGGHRFVVVAKVDRTPDRYPRPPGAPTKRPLG